MSKADLSLRLLAILRFTIPSNSSRTLNATQAYDVTPSGITLASATGKLLDKDVAVKDVDKVLSDWKVAGVGITVRTTGVGDTLGLGAEKAALTNPVLLAGSSATLTVVPTRNLEGAKNVAAGAKKRQSANIRQKCDTTQSGNSPPAFGAATTLGFTGTASGGRFESAVSKNSKATNPNTIFYGGIPVGTGDYKKWQGNYAVLKINTSTGNCVLRIYDA
jgi:hypothetical protein